MSNHVLITAKGTNSTLKNKNLIEIAGKASFLHGVDAAKKSGVIDIIFVSSDSDQILEIAENNGCVPLKRPNELCLADTNHGDVILFEYQRIKENHKVENLTILLGNTAQIFPEDIKKTYETLFKDENATSVMTVWEAQDDHPLRALVLNSDGYLGSYLEGEVVDTNRQSYRTAYFYDQGPWTVRSSTLEQAKKLRNGPGPWWWMGNKSRHILRKWVTGRDTHTIIDVKMAEAFLAIKDDI
jgi:N-acylneuraminate cytidylyltransferase